MATGRCRPCFKIARSNEGNPNWKGDKVGMLGLHEWIRSRKPRPQFCEECKTGFPIDLANISQEYKRDVNDFEWLCRRCHMIKDGRIEILKKQQERIHPIRYCEVCKKQLRSYTSKRCMEHIDKRGEKNPNFGNGKKIESNRNPNWKGGYPLCISCKIQLKNRKAKRCQPCYHKEKKGRGKNEKLL